jgi:hypothetical protein
MTFVVDTSVLIDHLRGNERAHAAIRDAIESGHLLVASVLTKAEVLAGMRPSEETATRALLESLQWVEVDDQLAERAGMLAKGYLRSHPDIDMVDYVIAATSDLLGAELWTRNVRHFPMFPGLNPPY